MTKSVVKDPVSNYDESKKLDADGVYGNMLNLHRNANPGRHWTDWEIAQGFDGSRSYFFTWDEYVDMQDMSTIWAVLVDFKGAGKHEGVGMAMPITNGETTETLSPRTVPARECGASSPMLLW